MIYKKHLIVASERATACLMFCGAIWLTCVACEARAEPADSPMSQETITVDIKAGRQYGAGVRVRAPMIDTSFVVPEGWRGAMPSGSQSFLLGSDTIPGVGVVVMFSDVAPEDPANVVARWQDLLAGMALKRIEQYTSGGGGGYNTSTVWNLCRDGRFTYSHASHVTIPEGRSVTRRSGSAPRYMACGGPWRRRRADPH